MDVDGIKTLLCSKLRRELTDDDLEVLRELRVKEVVKIWEMAHDGEWGALLKFWETKLLGKGHQEEDVESVDSENCAVDEDQYAQERSTLNSDEELELRAQVEAEWELEYGAVEEFNIVVDEEEVMRELLLSGELDEMLAQELIKSIEEHETMECRLVRDGGDNTHSGEWSAVESVCREEESSSDQHENEQALFDDVENQSEHEDGTSQALLDDVENQSEHEDGTSQALLDGVENHSEHEDGTSQALLDDVENHSEHEDSTSQALENHSEHEEGGTSPSVVGDVENHSEHDDGTSQAGTENECPVQVFEEGADPAGSVYLNESNVNHELSTHELEELKGEELEWNGKMLIVLSEAHLREAHEEEADEEELSRISEEVVTEHSLAIGRRANGDGREVVVVVVNDSFGNYVNGDEEVTHGSEVGAPYDQKTVMMELWRKGRDELAGRTEGEVAGEVAGTVFQGEGVNELPLESGNWDGEMTTGEETNYYRDELHDVPIDAHAYATPHTDEEGYTNYDEGAHHQEGGHVEVPVPPDQDLGQPTGDQEGEQYEEGGGNVEVLVPHVQDSGQDQQYEEGGGNVEVPVPHVQDSGQGQEGEQYEGGDYMIDSPQRREHGISHMEYEGPPSEAGQEWVVPQGESELGDIHEYPVKSNEEWTSQPEGGGPSPTLDQQITETIVPVEGLHSVEVGWCQDPHEHQDEVTEEEVILFEMEIVSSTDLPHRPNTRLERQEENIFFEPILSSTGESLTKQDSPTAEEEPPPPTQEDLEEEIPLPPKSPDPLKEREHKGRSSPGHSHDDLINFSFHQIERLTHSVFLKSREASMNRAIRFVQESRYYNPRVLLPAFSPSECPMPCVRSCEELSDAQMLYGTYIIGKLCPHLAWQKRVLVFTGQSIWFLRATGHSRPRRHPISKICSLGIGNDIVILQGHPGCNDIVLHTRGMADEILYTLQTLMKLVRRSTVLEYPFETTPENIKRLKLHKASKSNGHASQQS